MAANTRTKRREVVKAAAAVTGGIVAAGYVKPSMVAFGVPSAVAVTGGTDDGKGSIELDPYPSGSSDEVFLVMNGGGKTPVSAYGTFTLTQTSSDCTMIEVTKVELYLQEAEPGQGGALGGCGQDLTTGFIKKISGTTVDSGATAPPTPNTPGFVMTNPLTVGTVISDCHVAHQYSFLIAVPSGTIPADAKSLRATIIVDIEPSPQHDDVWHSCATVSL